MYFVTPDLAVGRRADAEDAENLAAHGIKSILSLCALARPDGITRQLSMDIKDRALLPAESIDEAMAFLKAQIQVGRKVLVHCEMGISRSASMAVGYLHGVLGMPLDEALTKVREANPMADPHPLLLESLRNHFCQPIATVNLAGNENPFGPSTLALAAINGAVAQLHRYPDREASALRDKLAARLDVAVEQILLGNGSCELIDHLVRACLSPGDEAIIPLPSFPVYRSATRAAGGTVVAVTMPDGAYCVDSILEKISPRTRLIMIGSPNNPTGTILSEAELQRLVNALPEQAWLLIDEAYRDYVDAGELADAMACIARGKNVIVMRSFSKAHGLAGLRIGYGIAPAWIARAIDRLRQSYNTNSMAQLAAVAALDDTAHLARTCANNASELQRVQRQLSAMGVAYIPSRANFVLVRGAADIAERLDRAGIQVKDMARFGAPEHFRVSIGLPEENTRFLQAFAKILQEKELQQPQEISQPVFA